MQVTDMDVEAARALGRQVARIRRRVAAMELAAATMWQWEGVGLHSDTGQIR